MDGDMENVSSGNRKLLSESDSAVTAEDLVTALSNPFNEHDAEILRSLGIAPMFDRAYDSI
jgi:hypothetical protein